MSIPLFDNWVSGYSITKHIFYDDDKLKKDFLEVFNQELVVKRDPQYPDYSWYETAVYLNGTLRDIMWEFITGWFYWKLTPGLQRDYVEYFKAKLAAEFNTYLEQTCHNSPA